MRKSLAFGTTAAVMVGLAITAVPATAETAVTFSLAGGYLEITTAPAAAVLTEGALNVGGMTVSGSLGTTTVTDQRGALLNNATVSMSATDFTNGPTTIPASAATGYSGIVTPDRVATVPIGTTVATAVNLATATTIVTMTSVGSGSATYNPTVSVAIPGDATKGTYAGTVTQTAS